MFQIELRNYKNVCMQKSKVMLKSMITKMQKSNLFNFKTLYFIQKST